MINNNVYAAVQNGIILDVFDTHEEAIERVKAEQKNDWLTVMFTKKLRKIFKKSGDVPMHKYSVIHIVETEEIK